MLAALSRPTPAVQSLTGDTILFVIAAARQTLPGYIPGKGRKGRKFMQPRGGIVPCCVVETK